MRGAVVAAALLCGYLGDPRPRWHISDIGDYFGALRLLLRVWDIGDYLRDPHLLLRGCDIGRYFSGVVGFGVIWRSANL